MSEYPGSPGTCNHAAHAAYGYSACPVCNAGLYGQSRRTVMKHSWLRAPSGFLYCRNCLLVCQWPLVRFDDDCGYEAPVRRGPWL